MVQTFTVEAPRRDFSEPTDIPAYVIRPAQPRDHRYHAPRLSRTSLRELRDLQRQGTWSWRLFENWRKHGRLSIDAIAPAHDPLAAELVSVMRYGASTRVYTGMAPVVPGSVPAPATGRRAALGVAGAGVMAAALALGVGLGTQLPQAAVASPAFVPASTLIASQNLPSKLPLIERQAAGQPLEVGVRAANLTYVAEPGDTFASVGRKFGLRPRTVRLVNMLPLGSRVTVGQKLVITPKDGAYHRVRAGETVAELAARYAVTETQINDENPGLKKGELDVDQAIFIPNASELRYREPHATKQRGYRTTEPWAKRLSASRTLIGSFSGRVGELAWPAAGQLSSPFGIRGYSFHPGVDICNAVGTSVRAAKGGVVVWSGWMGAYGYAVDIDHGGGVVTRYGHCSRLVVSAGQTVEAGQELAKMGSTGRSTGPHVHFEVRLQGRAVNPLAFF